MVVGQLILPGDHAQLNDLVHFTRNVHSTNIIHNVWILIEHLNMEVDLFQIDNMLLMHITMLSIRITDGRIAVSTLCMFFFYRMAVVSVNAYYPLHLKIIAVKHTVLDTIRCRLNWFILNMTMRYNIIRYQFFSNLRQTLLLPKYINGCFVIFNSILRYLLSSIKTASKEMPISMPLLRFEF